MHAWEAWGADCVKRFRGMFAFALWDERQQTLFLARDRLGVKPLYYALLPDGQLLFGSELKSLLAHGGARRDDRSAGGRGLLRARLRARAAHDLPRGTEAAAGHDAGRCGAGSRCRRPCEYWDVRFTLDSTLTRRAGAGGTARAADARSVRLRLISEVPLGAFLSGGVDSSAVVATMAGLSAEPVNTCSIAFADPAYDESAYALKVAERYKTRHFVDRVESDDFDLIDTLARLYDEPYADSSAMPTYRVCQLARKHVTVALSGDGGDESFGGYRRYKLHLMEERLRQPLPLGAAAAAVRAARPRLSEGGLGTAGVARQDDLRGAGARLRRGLLPQHEPAARCRPEARCTRNGFRAELAGYNAIEVFERHAGARESRRSAGADPVPRPEDLSRRRHQHQGRPRQHGALAGGARAADGPSAGRVAGHAAVVAEAAAAGRASGS